MTKLLGEQLGIGAHELVSLVGAGGKSTILFALGRELASRGGRVILTTTTRMAAAQTIKPTCWSDNPIDVEAALTAGTPLFVATGRVQGKVTGPRSDAIDRLYAATSADHVLVEADGSRSRSIKAPAAHEPVIPRTSTLVIVVLGADAIGRAMGSVAHRPDRITAITGLTQDDVVTTDDAAALLLHADGGLKGIPMGARVVMAITKVSRGNRKAADRLTRILGNHQRVERVVTVDYASDR